MSYVKTDVRLREMINNGEKISEPVTDSELQKMREEWSEIGKD